ncbi:MAG: ABC transporter ATP-binding protein [Planctomycetota bacterium]
MTAVIETIGLVKKFGRRRAVDGLSINVNRGDVYGFLGPNGSGKSTTMRTVLGLIKPTAGSVKLFGEDISANLTDALARIGAIIEEPAFYGHLSGRKNLSLYQAYGGKRDKHKIEEVLELTGLAGRARDAVGTYSHGMKKRLGIAAALVSSPELVMLDEPSTGLDPQGMKEVRDLIQRLARELDVTVFLSSHLLAEVEQVATRVGIIKEGKLLYEGDTAGLVRKSGRGRYRFKVSDADRAIAALKVEYMSAHKVGNVNELDVDVEPEDIGRVNRTIVQFGIDVIGITEVTPTLEDIFLNLTGEKK